MESHLNTFVTGLLISSVLTFIAAVIAWRRSVPGMMSLTWMLVGMSFWAGSYAIEWLPIPLSFKNILPNFTYIGVAAVPNLFLLFALQFANFEHFISKRLLVALCIEPGITLLLVWTNPYHHLVFENIIRREGYGVQWMEFVRGSWYEVNLLYSYAIITMGMAALLIGTWRAASLIRRQYYTILTAAMVPWIGNVIGEFSLAAVPYDLTPLMFGLSGILFTYSVMRNRLLDIISVARSSLIENMSDGVLVLDMENRIVDINPAMMRLLNHNPASLIGKSASTILESLFDQTEPLLGGDKTRSELRLPSSPSLYLDLRITPLFDALGRMNGRLMVFRDVSDRKQVEKKLRQANDRLQSQLIEIGTLQSKLRAQAIRDPLTNLFNRRYLDETLDRELARAAREHYPVCVIMMDLDHFKQVNDTYGHEAGDEVLKALAGTLTSRNRRGDFACRFGGEEFVVVLPNIDIEVACQRAEELRSTMNALKVRYGKFFLQTTLSIGVAAFPFNGDERESVLRAADRAMYAAKKAGRNNILTYNELEAQPASVRS